DGNTSDLNVNGSFDTNSGVGNGTSAALFGNVTAGNNVAVTSNEHVFLGITAGSVAVGIVGLGVGVGVGSVDANTASTIGSTATVSAGGNVDVKADYNLDKTGVPQMGLAIAGAGGFGGGAGAIIFV